jgi:hypothetical protein
MDCTLNFSASLIVKLFGLSKMMIVGIVLYLVCIVIGYNHSLSHQPKLNTNQPADNEAMACVTKIRKSLMDCTLNFSASL